MKSGKRDDLVVIERNSGSSENAFGEVSESWTAYTSAWAEVVYGTGAERRETANEASEQAATFRILADSTTLAITAQDRINFNGIWDIHSAVPLGRDGVEITAQRRAG